MTLKNKKLRVPEIIMPTESEMIATAEKWWEAHKKINFLDWNKELIKHTYDFTAIRFDNEIIDKVLSLPEHPEYYNDLVRDIGDFFNPIINKYNKNIFFKLITRSPKDYITDIKNYGKPHPLSNTKQILNCIVNSMRTFEDLCLLRYLPYPQFIIRPYVDFHPSSEWRILINNKSIIGISQYYYNEEFEYHNITQINSSIRKFINEIVIPNIDLDSFVADIVYSLDIHLLELNPFGLSDPCLFHSYDKLDGSFVYNKSGKPTIL